MRLWAAIGLLVLATPAGAQDPALTPGGSAARAAPDAGYVRADQVRVTARIVVVDRDALTRAGLSYVVLGNDRVRVAASGRQRRGARIEVGTHGVTAFLDAVRASRWVRSESTQQVLVLSGGEGVVSSQSLAAGRFASRTRGPSLVVSPSVLPDGGVHLWVSARQEDSVDYAWGYRVDGSPAAVETELIASDGEEVLLASSSSVSATRESGLLGWTAGEQGRDVLVSLTAEVVRR